MLIEDDIHFIHAPQHPTSSTTSTAWHMCTGLMDIQASISAIPRPANCQKIHRILPVVSKTGAVKQCKGGVSTGAILEHFKESICHFWVNVHGRIIPTAQKWVMPRKAVKTWDTKEKDSNKNHTMRHKIKSIIVHVHCRKKWGNMYIDWTTKHCNNIVKIILNNNINECWSP